MKILTILGARPQFIKAAALSKELRKKHQEIIVHTGQHYDFQMSDVFFNELNIPDPNYNLSVGSGTHGYQTGIMLIEIEKVILAEKPDALLVYGDTNSTLAGALAGAKLKIPVIHIEAGLRSYNRMMPEEINRVLTDHISNLLLCPSDTSVANLKKEGITKNVFNVGDLMLDSLSAAVEKAKSHSQILEQYELIKGNYLVLTLHRAENADDIFKLKNILNLLDLINEKIICPIHPRTRKMLLDNGIYEKFSAHKNLLLIEPLGYIDMIHLVSGARIVLTDSGGLQKEAYWLKVPCITLREETEWVETIQTGWNILTGTNLDLIVGTINSINPPDEHPPLYGQRGVAQRCVDLLVYLFK